MRGEVEVTRWAGPFPGASRSRVLALAVLTLTVVPAARAQETGMPPATPGAAAAVQASLEVERTLLKEDLARHQKIAEERVQQDARLAELHEELDAALRRDDPAAPDVIVEIHSKVDKAERERDVLLASEREVVESVRERLRRIDLFEDRLAALQARETEAAGPLSGKWDVVLLPQNQRGRFVLTQNGTLVSGTYSLEGGWTGSLQGTLVNRKVFLERIDSKLGRSAEFEGYLSTDGTQIRGTWLSYELSEGARSSGQWSAVRRPQGS